MAGFRCSIDSFSCSLFYFSSSNSAFSRSTFLSSRILDLLSEEGKVVLILHLFLIIILREHIGWSRLKG